MLGRVLVVRRDVLFGENDEGKFQGLMTANERDYIALIESYSIFARRDNVENDPFYKQPIAYALVYNQADDEYFCYQRSKIDQNYPDRRLQGKWSWGIGGHINEVDGQDTIIMSSMAREIFEEIQREDGEPIRISDLSIKIVGYINDDKNDVGKVHFGILFVATTSFGVIPKDPEISHGEMKTVNEMIEIARTEDVEEWSKIALELL